ncbi:MAG: D-arabinose 5-phosphate isomerase, partial [Sediminibacterium sp.]
MAKELPLFLKYWRPVLHCPLRLAPTTSTTIMLGLGDARAVALMEKRAFEAEDFKEFHPGGQLGKR